MALVTGLLGLVPVAVPAGVVGLVQTSGRRRAGRGLAITGLVAASVWTVVAVVVVVVVFLAVPDPRAGSPADIGATAVGQCLDAPADGADRWTPASCTAVHDGEVYLVEQLDGSSWPGEDELEGRADDACHAGFDDYVGRSWFESSYDYAWFSPDADDWADGERRLVCAVVPYEDDVLRAPVRGSGD